MIGNLTMTKPPVLAFVHVHYPEIWDDMKDALVERIKLPFHLLVTSSYPKESIHFPTAANLLSTRFLPVENRGRDIRPFLQALSETPDFTFGLKLHTKKSPQRLDGSQWRSEMMGSLLPSAAGTADIVARMEADERIGFVTPAGFALSVKPWVLVNGPGMEKVMSSLGHALAEDDHTDAFFAAGSMFWFRREALAALAQDKILALFEPEEGQLDGTIAHAMERLFPVEARRQGYLSLAIPALLASRPGMDRSAVLALARQYADIPSTYFPAPYVEALPPGTTLPQLEPRTAGHSTLRSLYHRLPMGLRMLMRRLLLRHQ